MSEKLDVYEFKMALFDNGNPEEFFLFIRNFQTNIKASGMLAAAKKIQYLLMLLHGKVLRKLGTLTFEVGITTVTYLNLIILGLGPYIFTVNALKKQKRAMRCGMRNPR